MKSKRHELILALAQQGEINSQEQIIAHLASHGLPATQATVSRDMRDLGLKKSRRGGKTVYVLDPAGGAEAQRRKYHAVLAGALLGVDGAGHIACVHCAPGMAQGACAALDALPPAGVVGSLAGEDTIFLLCRSEDAMRVVCAEIKQYLEDDQ
jgi:transcriptional regulator of arginine metabolism